MRALGHRQLTVEPEASEPIRVWVEDAAAVAYVHGHEWLSSDSGGEFYTRIDLARGAGGWTIERTDEVMQAEWPPPRTPKP